MEKDKRKERSTPRTVAPTKPADSDPHPARNAGWSVADIKQAGGASIAPTDEGDED